MILTLPSLRVSVSVECARPRVALLCAKPEQLRPLFKCGIFIGGVRAARRTSRRQTASFNPRSPCQSYCVLQFSALSSLDYAYDWRGMIKLVFRHNVPESLRIETSTNM